jgi:hypothetical protein
MSTNNSPNPEPTSLASASKPDPIRIRRENLIASNFLMIIAISLGIMIVGGVWAIKDLFTTNAFASFLELSAQSKIAIFGVVIIGLFILSIFLIVIYRRGKKWMLRMMFKDQSLHENKEDEIYLPAKIITACALISIFIIFLGLFIALIEYWVRKDAEQDFLGIYNFFNSLTGGTLILLVGIGILVFMGLILGLFFVWQNGYYALMKFILKNNEKLKIKHNFTMQQQWIGRVMFAILITSIIIIFFGIIWAIADAINPEGWGEVFVQYPFGIQFSVIGIFAAALFMLLIGAMMLYKWGNYAVMLSLFVKVQPEGVDKSNSAAKIITLGILIGISLISLSLIIWIISFAAGVISGDDVANLFVAIQGLSAGLAMMWYGIIIFVFLLLVLCFIYAFKNGYWVALKWVEKWQEAIDKSLDGKKSES